MLCSCSIVIQEVNYKDPQRYDFKKILLFFWFPNLLITLALILENSSSSRKLINFPTSSGLKSSSFISTGSSTSFFNVTSFFDIKAKSLFRMIVSF